MTRIGRIIASVNNTILPRCPKLSQIDIRKLPAVFSEIAASEGVSPNVVSISLSRTNGKIRKRLSYIAEDYGCGKKRYHTAIERVEYHTQKEIDDFESKLHNSDPKKLVKRAA